MTLPNFHGSAFQPLKEKKKSIYLFSLPPLHCTRHATHSIPYVPNKHSATHTEGHLVSQTGHIDKQAGCVHTHTQHLQPLLSIARVKVTGKLSLFPLKRIFKAQASYLPIIALNSTVLRWVGQWEILPFIYKEEAESLFLILVLLCLMPRSSL